MTTVRISVNTEAGDINVEQRDLGTRLTGYRNTDIVALLSQAVGQVSRAYGLDVIVAPGRSVPQPPDMPLGKDQK